jgi:hypothetical protein
VPLPNAHAPRWYACGVSPARSTAANVAFAALAALAASAACENGGSSDGSLLLSQYTSAGCTDVTSSFLQTYTGTYVDNPDLDSQTTSVTLGPGSSIDVQEMRQVGGNDGVPYPTSCSYFSRGKVLGVFQASSSKGCEALVPPDSGATSILVFEISQVPVNDAYPEASPAASPGCQTFQGAMQDQAASGALTYTVDLVLMGDAAFRFEDSGSGPTAGELLSRAQ